MIVDVRVSSLFDGMKVALVKSNIVCVVIDAAFVAIETSSYQTRNNNTHVSVRELDSNKLVMMRLKGKINSRHAQGR